MDVDVEEELDLHLKVDELDKRHKSERLSSGLILPPIDESSGRNISEIEDDAANLETSRSQSFDSVNGVVNELKRLSDLKTGKSKLVRQTFYRHQPSDTQISAWSLDESPSPKDCQYPIQARGLFTRQLLDGSHAIVIRGYDRFYNTGEVDATTWDTMQATTVGPYEVTIKEPGYIVYMAALEGHLLVTSRFAVGHAQREGSGIEEDSDAGARISAKDQQQKAALGQYVMKGEEWALKHLSAAGKTKQDLVDWLSENDVTAVFELVDDAVEDQALEDTNERKGLYVHGINSNTIGFHSWSSSRVSEFAATFGFHFNSAPLFNSLADVKVLADKCAETGTYQGRRVEGFVVRCQSKPKQQALPTELEENLSPTARKAAKAAKCLSHPLDVISQSFFFKVKFNVPLLLFREWREITKKLLTHKAVPDPDHPLSQKYLTWVREQVYTHPEMFDHFLANKGVVAVRDAFLKSVKLPTDPVSLADALRSVKVAA